MKQLLVIGGIAAAIMATVVWLDARDRELHDRSISVTTTQPPASTSSAAQRNVTGPSSIAGIQSTEDWPRQGSPLDHETVATSSTAPAPADASQPTILGLLTIAAALILAGAFSNRLAEIGLPGVKIKLMPEAMASAVNEIVTSTADTTDAVKDFIDRLQERLSEEHTLHASDITTAKEGTLKSFTRDISENILVEDTHEGLRVRITPPAADEMANVIVSTEGGLLPRSVFGNYAVEGIEAADGDLGRRLYALDRATEEVLAVLSYELPEAEDAPIVIDVLSTHSDPSRKLAVRACATILTNYLQTLAKKLSRDGVLIRLSHPPRLEEQSQLVELGFRPSTHVDTYAIARGIYWRQDPA